VKIKYNFINLQMSILDLNNNESSIEIDNYSNIKYDDITYDIEDLNKSLNEIRLISSILFCLFLILIILLLYLTLIKFF